MSQRVVQEWVRTGQLRAAHYGTAWRISHADLAAFVAQASTPTPHAEADPGAGVSPTTPVRPAPPSRDGRPTRAAGSPVRGARRYGLKMYGKAVHTIFQKLTRSYSC